MFADRLKNLLKDRHGELVKNAMVINKKDNSYSRKISVLHEDKTYIDFVIPQNDLEVSVFFIQKKSSIKVSLNICDGQYNFHSIPNNKLEIEKLYVFAEQYLEDIRYLGSNSLHFVMTIDK